MGTNYVLYGGRYTRATLVEMVLLEGALPYEVRDIDIHVDEHRQEAYLAVNPAGWVPALVTPSGETLYETPAINLYLAEHHGLTHLAPSVEDPLRGRFLSALFYLHDEVEPALKRNFYPHRYVRREEDTAWMRERALGDVLERYAVIDRRLAADGPFHLGQRFSLADLVAAYWLQSIEIPPGDLPAARRCLELVRARPLIAGLFDEQARAWEE